MESHAYHVNVKWSRDRIGVMCSPELEKELRADGCIQVATPPPFPKGTPGIWSPEHLFTAAVSSCFLTTFLAIAENSKLAFSEFSCQATGILGNDANKLMMTEVSLEPRVVVDRSSDFEKADRIIRKTEAACLISNSVLNKITVKPIIETTKPV